MTQEQQIEKKGWALQRENLFKQATKHPALIQDIIDAAYLAGLEAKTLGIETIEAKWEKWIDYGLNSFISVGKDGEEYLDAEDIANAKTHLSQLFRDLLQQKTEKDVERIEELRKIERYTLAASIVVDEKNINYNAAINDVIAILKEK